jgi:membrane-bound serine protease (ClpP class)
MDEVMSKKVTSDAAAYVRGKAERRGRNPALAEKAVTESVSFTEREALDAKLIDLVVPDVKELVEALDGREVTRFDGRKVTLRLAGQPTVPVSMNWRRTLLSLVARPEIMLLLLLGALAGLGTEISHPGTLFPGILGTLCLILFLFASQVLPVNGAGVLLILLAVLLFALEVKITSYGLLTVGGLVAMILGAMMLVEAPVAELRIGWFTLLSVSLAMAAWTIAVVRLVIQAQRRRATTGASGMLGQHGVAESDLRPTGWVIAFGERWKAEAETPLDAGERVVVTGMDGLTLKVRKES